LLGRVVDSLVSQAIELPFVDAMEADDARFPTVAAGEMRSAPVSTRVLLAGGSVAAPNAVIITSNAPLSPVIFEVTSASAVYQHGVSESPRSDVSYLAAMIEFLESEARDLLDESPPTGMTAMDLPSLSRIDRVAPEARLPELAVEPVSADDATEGLKLGAGENEQALPIRAAKSLLMPVIVFACGLNAPLANERSRPRVFVGRVS
jgi:hypothetical protein